MTDLADDLQRFLRTLRSAFDAATLGDPVRRALARRLFERLDGLGGETGAIAPVRLPACRHFEAAVAAASTARDDGPDGRPDGAPDRWPSDRAPPATTAALARALAALEPALRWYRRAGAEAHGPTFPAGHANAFVVGPGGIADRAGVSVGVSLMAPGLRYPDHSHPPEELYLVLSPGHWRRSDTGWFEPGPGGTVHNVPDVVHAMRSGAAPLLAIWCLLEGSRDPS